MFLTLIQNGSHINKINPWKVGHKVKYTWELIRGVLRDMTPIIWTWTNPTDQLRLKTDNIRKFKAIEFWDRFSKIILESGHDIYTNNFVNIMHIHKFLESDPFSLIKALKRWCSIQLLFDKRLSSYQVDVKGKYVPSYLQIGVNDAKCNEMIMA